MCLFFFSLSFGAMAYHSTGKIVTNNLNFSNLCTIQKFGRLFFSNIRVSSETYKISIAIFVPSADGHNTLYVGIFYSIDLTHEVPSAVVCLAALPESSVVNCFVG